MTLKKKSEKLILNGMARDYYQRENLSKGIIEANEEDLIYVIQMKYQI